MKKQFTIFLILLFALGLFNVKFSNADSNSPIIYSISPDPGRIGDTIEILGEKFDNFVDHTQMKISPSGIGRVISWSDSRILLKFEDGDVPIETVLGIGSNYIDETGNERGFVILKVFSIKATCKSGDDWTCSDYGACSSVSGVRTRTCVKSNECQSLNSLMPSTTTFCLCT